MTFEQLVYRASMQEQVDLLQEVMQSEETAETIALARVDQKLDELKGILSTNLAELMGDGLLKRRLRGKLDELSLKSEALQTTINTNLPLLDRFVEECNDLLLATGPQNEYLLDICSVTSDQCINSEEDGTTFGVHSGCCCGVVPSVGQFDIPAAGQAAGRRLQAELRADQEVDVCGYAYQASAQDWENARGQLEGITGGQQVIDDFERGQEEAYPNFADRCSIDAGRRLDEHLERQKMEVEDLPSDEPSTGSVDDKTSDRRLQSYLTCDPPSSSTNENMTDPLKVAFWDKTESALCKDITEDGVTMTNARMAEICSDFCTPTAVPFLLGTTSFGFTHTQLDSVCLSPEDENVLYSAESVNTCHEKANSFRDLQMSTSYFASALQVLDASKIRFEAEAKQAAEGLKTLIRDQAKTVLDNAARSQKIVELETLMQTGLEDILVNGVVKRQLKEDALRVKDRATTLQTDLARVLPDVQAFLTECNIMTTGVGPSDEYLLDMCSQTSTQCVGAEEGVHVGCCCGYNPVVTLGTSGVLAVHQPSPELVIGMRVRHGLVVGILAPAGVFKIKHRLTFVPRPAQTQLRGLRVTVIVCVSWAVKTSFCAESVSVVKGIKLSTRAAQNWIAQVWHT